MEFALFLTGGIWVLAARSAADHAAHGLFTRFHLQLFEPLASTVFLLFLLLIGFCAIHWIATRAATVRGVNCLPARATRRKEWALGAAVGWSLVTAAVLLMAAGGALHPSFWWQPRAFGSALLSTLTLFVYLLTVEATFRGYLFSRLVRAIGLTAAALLMSAIYAAGSAFHPYSSGLSIVVTFFFGLLLSMAYLRTHALWLPWGLHFGWVVSMSVVFGLPVGGVSSWSSVVDTSSVGPVWLTGGFYGPESAFSALPILVAGMVVLYSLTRDFAWQYTHAPIVAAGYAMDVPPPAEHVKMEKAAAPAPLVQILATTPNSSSTMPAVEEHLRATAAQQDS